MSKKIKEVPDIQRWAWLNPNEIEKGLTWEKKEYPFSLKVDLKGIDPNKKVVFVEAKKRAKKDHVYQVIAQKYCYLYTHLDEDFRNILLCETVTEDAKTLATEFDIEIFELPPKAVAAMKLDISLISKFLTSRQLDAFKYVYVQRLPESEVANKMGISKARVSALKKQIETKIRNRLGNTRELIKVMKKAPEVFKEDLDEIGDLVG